MSDKSDIRYPDENLVRLLKKNISGYEKNAPLTAIDLGCGSGRHLKLLNELRIGRIIGLDSSFNALLLSKKRFNGFLVAGDNRHIPIKDGSADFVIAWGSLHYNRKETLPLMLGEIVRVLVPDGHLFATLRTSRDTYLKTGKHLGNNTWATNLNDINGTIVSFYSEDELTRAFSAFGKFEFGLMERTLVGDTRAMISHWVVHAIK